MPKDMISSSTLKISNSISNILMANVTSVALSNSEIQKFSSKVSEFVHDEEFLKELNGKIGDPLPQESEDEFVDRAKNTMKNLLKNKFK